MKLSNTIPGLFRQNVNHRFARAREHLGEISDAIATRLSFASAASGRSHLN
jgi:hypothetical protein